MAANDAKEEIRRRLDVVEVVSQYVPLQRAGRRFSARCPFHQEKTPSFFVDPERGFWKCFGCGASGDIFSFVMQIEGLTFPEAAERLAQRAGVEWRSSPGGEQTGRERQAVLQVNATAANWFRHKLFEPEGKVGLDYLRGRGLSDETIREFMLGYAPEGWDHLTTYLTGRGLSERLLTTAGLAKSRGAGGGCYDFFRHRVMFPVVEVTSRVVAFGGRALDPEEKAKYINSPDTPVFRKGATVYGLNLAREHIVQAKQAIVVEGYMDVIALVQAGIRNVVACLGTATTEEHLKLLSRYAESIVFVYDADTAGMRAALRNIATFEAAGASARLAVLPPGQDPDECVRSSGPGVFRRCVAEAMSFAEYEIKMAFEQFDMGDADGRMRAAREAVNSLLKVQDRARREELLDRVAARWAQGDLSRSEQLARVLRLELGRRFTEQRGQRWGRNSRHDRGHIAETLARTAGAVEPRVLRLEAELLTVVLHDGERARQATERLSPEDFRDPDHRRIAEALWPLAQGEAYVPAEVVEAFAEGEPAHERAIELLVGEVAWSEEEFAEAIAKMEYNKATHGLRPKYEVTPAETPEGAIETDGEDFEAWRRRVAAAIDSGEITPDDPDFIRFMQLGRRFQGAGQQGFVEHAGLTAFSATTGSAPGPETPEHPDAESSLDPDERS
jgi:DNA primase